jgi:hypothetical protein
MWMLHKKYVFTEAAVAAIAKKHLPKGTGSINVKTIFKAIHKEFESKYPGHILPESHLQWMFMNAGGWMGSMCIIHASLTEYVLFFGTALDTTGHSGRYWANISDTVLTGEFHQWPEAEFTALVHKPGTTVAHEWGTVTSVHFKANTWMLEYGRGFIPSTLGFALADTLFSTHDFITLFYVCRVYAHAALLEASYYMTHLQELFS